MPVTFVVRIFVPRASVNPKFVLVPFVAKMFVPVVFVQRSVFKSDVPEANTPLNDSAAVPSVIVLPDGGVRFDVSDPMLMFVPVAYVATRVVEVAFVSVEDVAVSVVIVAVVAIRAATPADRRDLMTCCTLIGSICFIVNN